MVNPPHTPTLRNSIHECCWQQLVTNPMQNDPTIFVRKVPMVVDHCSIVNSRVIPYRMMAPQAPPKPTKIRLRIMVIAGLLIFSHVYAFIIERLGYGVVTRTSKGIATKYAFEGQPSPFEGPVFLNGFNGVLRTCGGITTCRGCEWGYAVAIKGNEFQHYPLQDFFQGHCCGSCALSC